LHAILSSAMKIHSPLGKNVIKIELK
jgi:hypothetical protein